jgi:protein-L-isoaspartate O-methyltransferase
LIIPENISWGKKEHHPYVDTALSIGHGQTINQRSTVARSLMLAELVSVHDVQEIGFGSGWNACLIAYHAETMILPTVQKFYISGIVFLHAAVVRCTWFS